MGVRNIDNIPRKMPHALPRVHRLHPLSTLSFKSPITTGLTPTLCVPVGQSSGRPYYMHSIAAEALSLAMYGEGRLDYCSLMDDSFKPGYNSLIT